MRVTNFDLKVGDVVFIKTRDPWNPYPYPYGPSRRWPFELNQRGMKGGLFLSVERGNRWCGHVKNYRDELITFQSKRDVERFCQEHGFVLEKEEGCRPEKYKLHCIPGREEVSESYLQAGDTVTVRRHTSESLYLVVEKNGIEFTILCDEDHSTLLFEKLRAARLYCIERDLELQIPDDLDSPRDLGEEDQRSDLRAEELTREKGCGLQPIPDREKLIPSPDLEVLELLVKDDLAYLDLLLDLRKRFQVWFNNELGRRRALGSKSCTCSGCVDRLLSPLNMVEEEIARLRSQLELPP